MNCGCGATAPAYSLNFAGLWMSLMIPPVEMRENIKGRSMDKSTIIAKLREHESELKAAGIEHLFLHGSYARGTAVRETSDVDVIAEFAPGRRLTLLDMVAIE